MRNGRLGDTIQETGSEDAKKVTTWKLAKPKALRGFGQKAERTVVCHRNTGPKSQNLKMSQKPAE